MFATRSPQFYRERMSDPTRILIGCSGSVAAIKLEELVEQLLSAVSNSELRVIITEHARHFTPLKKSVEKVIYYTDEDEWKAWNKMGDNVLHIELGKWADVFVIAPLSANSLAKMANGLCDNLLTCTVRAWDMRKPLLFAPAMNTRMLQHPITRPQINSLVSFGYIEIPTVVKMLACGEKGDGAMASVNTIVDRVVASLKTSNT
ncbi:phosphopantothenoylcysteine decarboxylase-like [Watersipora subatra]|uniref:phosphopantothenoylcysteine decarboxylase-like n=1 Tax=Watersipora subatra TaxID=2589382 RepID=UPI00355B9F6A